jgi:hypothetical protein
MDSEGSLTVKFVDDKKQIDQCTGDNRRIRVDESES